MHLAVDTWGHVLALHLTPANEGDRSQVAALSQAVQEATGQSVQLAWVDQGYSGEQTAEEAAQHGIELEVVKLQEAKKGFVLLPRRWSWSVPLLGLHAFDAWPKTTSVSPKPSQD